MATRSEYLAIYTGLMGVLVIPLFALFITSCVAVPLRRDPARRGFLWLKLGFGFMFLGQLLVTVYLVIATVLDFRGSSVSTDSDLLLTAINHVSDWGFFFLELSQIFNFMMLVDLALGLLLGWNIMMKVRPIFQWVTYGFSAMLFIFIVIFVAKFEKYETDFYNYTNNSSANYSAILAEARSLRPYQLLLAAFDILLWIATLCVLGVAIFTVILSNKQQEHRASSVLFLCATICFFIGNTWSLAADATWLIPQATRPDTWDLVLAAILEYWLQFVGFVLVFAIGVKKVGGLWSTPQNFGQPQQYYYDYNGQPVQPQYYQQYPAGYAQPQGYAPSYPTSAVPEQLDSQPRTELAGQKDQQGQWPSELRGTEAAREMSATPRA